MNYEKRIWLRCPSELDVENFITIDSSGGKLVLCDVETYEKHIEYEPYQESSFILNYPYDKFTPVKSDDIDFIRDGGVTDKEEIEFNNLKKITVLENGEVGREYFNDPEDYKVSTKFESKEEYLEWCAEKVQRIKTLCICMNTEAIHKEVQEIDTKLKSIIKP